MTSNFIYKCNECKKGFQKKFDLLQHKNIHSDKTPFMCISCRKSFRLVEEYVDHIKHIDIQENYDKCEFKEVHSSMTNGAQVFCKKCLESFENSENFKKHLCSKSKSQDLPKIKNSNACHCCACQINQNKVNDLSKEYSQNLSCEYCNKKFSTGLRLSKHACFVSLSGENFKCSCSLIFTKASAFKAHVGQKPYSCCGCSMQFNTITNLVRHIRTHTKQKPYVCKDCGRGFSQSANLRNHSSIHLGIRAIKCNECNFSCKTLNGLIKHKKKHEGLNHQNYVDGRKKSTKKSTCPICNKQFMFKRNMGMHMKIHSNKVSLCTECGKVFDTKSKLTSHYKACHQEPSVCKICGKVFASAVLLGAHEKIHVSDKLFSCNFCQKTFSVKNYLVQHMKTHSNKKQFSCSKCGKLFKVAVSLKYHSNICTSLNVPV